MGKACPPSLMREEIGMDYMTNFSYRESRIDCTSALIGRMSHKILGPKVYDPSLAKKTLGRAERTLYERLKDSEEIPLLHLRNEEAFMSPKSALDEYLFENVPDATMQLGQERHRREICSFKLEEIERELQEFSEVFGSQLVELKKSMGEFALSMKELMHYDEGNYIEDRLWEEANTDSKAVGAVTSKSKSGLSLTSST